MSLDQELSIPKAPEHSSGAKGAGGDLGTWGLYSLKLKAVPHPKSLKRLPLNVCYQTSYASSRQVVISLKAEFWSRKT